MAPKRKADTGQSSAGTSKKAAVASDLGALVNAKRVRTLKDGDVGAGPVLYW